MLVSAVILGTLALATRTPERRAQCVGTLVAAYVPPEAFAALPGSHTLIVNPASGPGERPSAAYRWAISRAQANGSRVLGYVATTYAKRDPAAVEADAERYRAWYGVDGIFLDEVTHDEADLPYYQGLRIEAPLLVLNPGMVPARGYFDLADLVVTYEGPFADYARRLASEPGWVRDERDRAPGLRRLARAGGRTVRRTGPQHLSLRHVGRATQPLGRPAAVPAGRKEHAMPVTRTIVLAAIALAGAPAAALAQAPPGPPGPPPGNGTDLPAPPGTAPAFVPAGTPATIPGGATGPGLLTSGDVALNRARRTLSIRFACQGSGSIRITALGARGSYRCAGGRATAKLKLSKKVAARAAKRRVTPATATLRQGARTQRVAFTLRAGGKAAKAKGFWTDGRLQCAQDGAPAYLVQPDFTTASATPISTRGWIAWYTAAGGWHWLGSAGRTRAAGTRGRPTSRGSSSSTREARRSRSRTRGARSRSRPGRRRTPSASTRSSTGSAGGRTTSGSTSTRARPVRPRPARAATTA